MSVKGGGKCRRLGRLYGTVARKAADLHATPLLFLRCYQYSTNRPKWKGHFENIPAKDANRSPFCAVSHTVLTLF
jgi:hypothetical protein